MDEYLYELSGLTGKVAVEIQLYMEGKPLGTKHRPFPTAKKLEGQLSSKKAISFPSDLDLYFILVPEEERGSLGGEEMEKLREKRDSLVFRLKGINYHNPEELERLRDYCLEFSEATGIKANF